MDMSDSTDELWGRTLRGTIVYIFEPTNITLDDKYNNPQVIKLYNKFNELFNGTIEKGRLIDIINRLNQCGITHMVSIVSSMMSDSYNITLALLPILLTIEYKLLTVNSCKLTVFEKQQLNNLIVKIHYTCVNLILTSNYIDFSTIKNQSRSLIRLDCAL